MIPDMDKAVDAYQNLQRLLAQREETPEGRAQREWLASQAESERPFIKHQNCPCEVLPR